jgi:hypothetical protein
VESRRGDKRRPRQHLELLEPRILPRPTWGLSAGLSGYLTGAETTIECKGFNTDLSLVAHWRHDRRDDRGALSIALGSALSTLEARCGVRIAEAGSKSLHAMRSSSIGCGGNEERPRRP